MPGNDTDILNGSDPSGASKPLNRGTILHGIRILVSSDDEPCGLREKGLAARDFVHQVEAATPFPETGKNLGIDFIDKAVIFGIRVTFDEIGGPDPRFPTIPGRELRRGEFLPEEVNLHSQSLDVMKRHEESPDSSVEQDRENGPKTPRFQVIGGVVGLATVNSSDKNGFVTLFVREIRGLRTRFAFLFAARPI